MDLGYHRKHALRQLRRRLYVLRHGRPQTHVPVFIFGVQRSGTTLLIDRLGAHPAAECFGEASRAFVNCYLQPNGEIGRLIDASKVPYVVFKPLTASHRVHELLGLRHGAKAVWMLRRPEDRASSAVANAGSDNLRAVRAVATGNPIHTWHAMGISQETRRILRHHYQDGLSPHDGAALIWLARNRLYFEQALHEDERVRLVRYEDLVSTTGETMRALCEFLGLPFSPALTVGIHSRSVGKAAPTLSPHIRARCDDLYRALSAHALATERAETYDWSVVGASALSARAPLPRLNGSRDRVPPGVSPAPTADSPAAPVPASAAARAS